MKKTFYVLGMAALMAGFTACNSGAEKADNKEAAKVEKTDADSKCGEGKCGEGKCGTAAPEKKKSKFDMMDTDADGQISQEEFIAFVSTKFSVKDADGSGNITKEECAHFDILDTDGDNSVTEQEFNDGLGKVFESIDADANGFITKEEMKAHVKGEEASADAATEKKCGEGKCGK